MWKTDPNRYAAVHQWARRHFGTPKECEMCGATHKRMYHWANISGLYLRERSDWRRLCVSCHKMESHPGYCINGHEKTPDNIDYFTDKHGSIHTRCLTCKNKRHSIWKRARRLALND